MSVKQASTCIVEDSRGQGQRGSFIRDWDRGLAEGKRFQTEGAVKVIRIIGGAYQSNRRR